MPGAISPRELEVLQHVRDGADNLKIAATLGISERTVKAHVHSLYRKMEVENRVEMAVQADAWLAPATGIDPGALEQAMDRRRDLAAALQEKIRVGRALFAKLQQTRQECASEREKMNDLVQARGLIWRSMDVP